MNFQEYTIIQARIARDLATRISAIQMVLEQILQQLDPDSFSVQEFRKQLAELQEQCRESDMLMMELKDPAAAAKLDADHPAKDFLGGDENPGA